MTDPFEIRESADGVTWTQVGGDTVYMNAYKAAQRRSQQPALPRFQQVIRRWSTYELEDGKRDEPMVTFCAGMFHYFERQP